MVKSSKGNDDTTAGAEDIRVPVVKVRGLRTQFGDQVIHDGLDLDIYSGEIVGLVGGSGTGKSVLLRTIIGLARPVAGSLEVFGKELSKLSFKELRAAQRDFGVLFQNGALFSALSVAQNIQTPLLEHFNLPRELLAEITALKISMVGLPLDACAKLPSELSGGMRKRAGLARALAMEPKLLFLDEPTAGLDPIGAAAFDELIASLRDRLGLTVFMITHDLDSLFSVCDRVAVLAENRVIVNAPLLELLDHPHPWIQDYFHGTRGRAIGKTHRRPSEPRQTSSDNPLWLNR